MEELFHIEGDWRYLRTECNVILYWILCYKNIIGTTGEAQMESVG